MLRIDLPSTLITFLLAFLWRPFYRAAFNPQTAEFVPYRSGARDPPQLASAEDMPQICRAIRMEAPGGRDRLRS
jgi:hypothetical protein